MISQHLCSVWHIEYIVVPYSSIYVYIRFWRLSMNGFSARVAVLCCGVLQCIVRCSALLSVAVRCSALGFSLICTTNLELSVIFELVKTESSVCMQI